MQALTSGNKIFAAGMNGLHLQPLGVRGDQVFVHRADVPVEVELEAGTVGAMWTLVVPLPGVGQHVVPELLLAVYATDPLPADGTHHGRYRLRTERGSRYHSWPPTGYGGSVPGSMTEERQGGKTRTAGNKAENFQRRRNF